MNHNKSLVNKAVLIVLIISAIATCSIYTFFSFQRYFQGDDFPMLLENAAGLKILLSPQGGVHFRPVERLHFFLQHIFALNPIYYNLWSLFMHLLASFSLYLAVKAIYDKKIALYSTLLFFTLFPYNEAVYWTSQTQLLYALFFVFLAIYFYHREHNLLACIFNFFASFSYTLWLVLPVYFVFIKRKNKRSKLVKYFSFALLVFHLFLVRLLKLPLDYYSPVKKFSEIPFKIMGCLLETLFPFTNSPSFFVWAGLVIGLLATAYLFFAKRDKYWLPIVFYWVPSVIFLLSQYTPSRFFYFPVAGIAIFVSIGYWNSRKIVKFFFLLFICYMAILSPVVNYLDGHDYALYSLEYEKVISDAQKALKDVKVGETVLLVNRVPYMIPLIYSKFEIFIGRVKILFNRGKGVAGLINLDNLVDFVLFERGLRGIRTNIDPSVKPINMGKGLVISEYCFKIVNK